MEDREELEHVPWADLMAEAEPEDRRRKTIYLGVAIVGAMVLGMIVARSWWAAPPPSTPLAPGDSAVAATTLPDVADLPLYTEADLMAMPPDPSARLAMVRAEWFVTDYFTADLDPNGSAEVRAALPATVAAEMSLDVGAAVSYVEWARAFRVEEVGDGTYRVALAPGTYVVDIAPTGRDRARGLPATVAIASGQTVRLDIDIDTGMR